MRFLRSTLSAALLVLGASSLSAHAVGENYVWLNVEDDHLAGRFEIRLADLEREFELDFSRGPVEARAVLRAAAPEIEAYLRESFSIFASGTEVPYTFGRRAVVEAGDLGDFAQFHYRTAPFVVPDRIDVRNVVLLDTDRLHRSLLCIQYDKRREREYGEEFTALVFSRSRSRQTLDLTDVRGLLRVRDFVWQGVLHIWAGIDHVLFLVALLLTSVLWRPRPNGDGADRSTWIDWRPVEGFRPAFWNVVKIVTLFTIAHSITLSLAALGIIDLPSRLVESIIALSIVLIALNNVFPKLRDGNAAVILFFGLFHGLGFASVMGELPFRMGSLVRVVLAFNVGVELGQIALVAAIFPLLFWLRRRPLYKPVVLGAGSLAIGLMATYWFVTRAFGGA